jgi:PIN domain nuclease of toxin-antitoxin system
MQIKIQLGKMRLTLPLAQIIAEQQSKANVEMLPVSLGHVLALDKLPMHHKDPFDRLLIAQAIAEDAVLVSKDEVFGQYSVNVEW